MVAEQILWTPADGSTPIDLTDPSSGYSAEAEGTHGFRSPVYRFATSTFSGLDGALVDAVNVEPARPTLGLLIEAGSEAQLRSRLRALIHAMRPKAGPGTLTVVTEDGVRRSLTAYLEAGLEGDESERTHLPGRWWRAALRFFAPTPWWEADAETVSSGLGGGEPFFPLPPVKLSPSLVAGKFSIDCSDSDAPAYPVWTITGPGSNLVLTNNTTGRTISVSVTLAAGETLVINTRPGFQSVRKYPPPPTSQEEARRNLATHPRATVSIPDTTGVAGWWPRWYGNGGAGVTSYLKPGDETRRNLAPNPSAEVDITTGVTTYSIGTFTEGARNRVADTGGGSSFVYEVTANFSTTNNQIGWFFEVAIAAGEKLSVAMMARLLSTLTNQHVRIYVDWYDGAGALLAGAVSVITSQTTWQRTVLEDKTAPANTAKARIYFWAASSEVGVLTARFDQILVVKSRYIGDYFDGSTADTADHQYDWVSTAHLSESTRKVAANAGGPLSIPTFGRKEWAVTPTSNALTGWQMQRNNGYPVTAGVTYSATGFLRSSADNKYAEARFHWYDSGGTFLSSSLGGTSLLPVGQWSPLSVTGTAPAGAVTAFITMDIRQIPESVLWAPGDMLDGTALLFEQTGTVGAYFDGETPDEDPYRTGSRIYAWTGAVDASASTESVVSVGEQTDPGTNQLAAVTSDPALWPLIEDVNDVSATLTGATSASRIAVTYRPRYAGA